MPVALPPASKVSLDNQPSALSAYNVCLDLENRATNDEGRMHARILGYLILEAPSSMARVEVVKAIHSCARLQNDAVATLLELAESFRLWFILPFKKFKGRTPTPTSHASRPSFDRVKEQLKENIREAPKDHSTAKVQALVRDGYKCIVTGIYDRKAKQYLDTVKTEEPTVHTELAHILPESTFFDVSTSSPGKKRNYAASILAVMQRFGYDVEKLNGAKVHSLYNVMTMQKDVHDAFDRLELWFESTEVANHYRVQVIHTLHFVPSEVSFKSPDPAILPYPSQQLLGLHAACAKVAHLSGAGEYIDKFDRDADDLDTLATNGSSLEVLTHAIMRSMSRPVSTAA